MTKGPFSSGPIINHTFTRNNNNPHFYGGEIGIAEFNFLN